MDRKEESWRLVRRDFLGWLCKLGGGATAFTLASGAVPLRKVNTTLFGAAAHAQTACGEDTCTVDICPSGDAGHVCQARDVCDEDYSGDCTNDECVADSSLACENDVCVSDGSGTCAGDRCTSDASGDCVNDGGPACPEDAGCEEDWLGGCRDDFSGTCETDSSGGCENDSCRDDSSGACKADVCTSDSSKGCETDYCVSDSSGQGANDECVSDSSGECTNDSCVSDGSGSCGDDLCTSDSSGEGQNDECAADSSGTCTTDFCVSDSSGDCETDYCVSDSSKAALNDDCVSDSSGECSAKDTCVADSSAECATDWCTADASGACGVDRGISDSSGACALIDVCVLDTSSSCSSDLCRDDRTPIGSECATSDTCALDLAMDLKTTRRKFAKAGVNKAIKLLYKLACVVLFMGIAYGQSQAQTVIDARDAVFYPTPTYVTDGEVTVTNPVGPFLRDCDGDGVLEADVDGDGNCDGDPEVLDYNGDSTRELPEGTAFTGSFEFTCFYIPDDVAIVATGPLTVAASREIAIFGALRVPDGARFEALTPIDLRTSAWLSEAGEGGSGITIVTARAGTVNETAGAFFTNTDGVVTLDSIPYTSVCASAAAEATTNIPTLNQWGAIILGLIMFLAAILALARRKPEF